MALQQVHCRAIFEAQLSAVYMKTKQEGLNVSIFSFVGGTLVMTALWGAYVLTEVREDSVQCPA